ncbi:nucleotide exchange factor GrpE [Proteiniborus sp. MB09-C3]|uniref:nucleotide exchange factor GrpE n=1 Tax=Proteiniborus sp. MB09-C3 TaxID=3050072 RepID=UPI002555F506|nr:nucleotide exchange factor GrpE [Proteiniborus sp. MB09-C3]WIV10682.1 nucleotide exchange factor GrpE [Proteiniborus sp. MB09-C3]
MEKKAKEDFVEPNLENECIDSTIEEMENDKEMNMEELLEKYNNKISECEELSNRYVRLQADFNNFKKRTEKEKESIYQYAAQELITSLLPVMDNFDRALKVDTEESTVDNLYKGVEMVYKQLIESLQANGLEEINAVGEKFDPNYHHAVAQEENDDYDADVVTEVFLKGYKVKDKVIRPSMVKVSK